MTDYLWMGELPDWTLVEDLEKKVGLTHSAHRCLLGHTVSCLLYQLTAWRCDGVHT